MNKIRIPKSTRIRVTRPPCIGEVLESYYASLSRELETFKMTEEERRGAYGVMGLTDLNLSSWCGCERCKKHISKLESFIGVGNEQLWNENDMPDGSQQETNGGADLQS